MMIRAHGTALPTETDLGRCAHECAGDESSRNSNTDGKDDGDEDEFDV